MGSAARRMGRAGYLSLALCICFQYVTSKSVLKENFELNIIHMNDIHAHFDEISLNAGRCHQAELAKDECFGGMARMFTAIQEYMEISPNNTLLLNAGDYFQGTMWFSEFKYEPVVEFGNLLNWTAMGLGNHDFDLGAEDLADFSKQTNFDLLACNMVQKDGENNPINFQSSKTVEINGTRIGIIGYVTTDTPNITAGSLGTLEFLDEIENVQKEAQRLKALDPPIEILIALGHAGYIKDLEMAAMIPEIDIVVGGHSHSFLYSGEVAENMVEEVEGDFPTYVTQPSGKVVPVVQVYKYSKYLGYLALNFDGHGELVEPVNGGGVARADVTLIDKTYPRHEWVETKLEKYRERLSEYYEEVGETTVLLEKHDNVESNIGNVLTDSMVLYSKWNDTNIAFINNGGIRGTIEIGTITGEDIIGVLPFGNTIDRVTMYGSSIKGILEEYASGLCANKTCDPPTFLQMSGLKVVYDIYQDQTGERVTSLKERCGDSWCNLKMEQLYPVALVSFLANGGSYLFNFPSWIETREIGDIDYPALKQYVAENSPINMTTEGRITINYHDDITPTTTSTSPDSDNSGHNISLSYVLIYVVIFSFLLANNYRY